MRPDYNNVKNVLFVCKYNVFRSKIAEEYFKKINKNKKIKIASRGFIVGGAPDRAQLAGARMLRVKLKGKPKPVNLKELLKADLIILIADDVPKIMFNYWLAPLEKKIIVWKIKDEQRKNMRNIEKIVNRIKKNIEKLVKDLSNVK